MLLPSFCFWRWARDLPCNQCLAKFICFHSDFLLFYHILSDNLIISKHSPVHTQIRATYFKLVCIIYLLNYVSPLFVTTYFLFGWQAKVHDLAGDDYRASVLGSINEWIKVVSSVYQRVHFFHLIQLLHHRYLYYWLVYCLVTPSMCCIKLTNCICQVTWGMHRECHASDARSCIAL